MNEPKPQQNIYQHYIRINSEGLIVYAFTSAFEKPIEGDILVFESTQRLFDMEFAFGLIPLMDASVMPPKYNWRWDGSKIVPSEPVENEDK